MSDRNDRIRLYEEKLDGIQLPAFEISKLSFIDGLNLIQRKSVEFDSDEHDPVRKGINIIASIPEDTLSLHTPVSLVLNKGSLRDALTAITHQTGTKFRIESHAVVVTHSSSKTDQSLILKQYEVLLNFPASKATPSPQNKNTGNFWSSLEEKKNAVFILKSRGITFPKGATAVYNQKTMILTVKNTANELARVQLLVDKINLEKQLEIHKKLNRIVFPSLELNGIELDLSLAILMSKSVELDFHEMDRYSKGVRFYLDQNIDKRFAKKTITIRITNTPLGEAFRYVTEIAGAEYKIQGTGILVSPSLKP